MDFSRLETNIMETIKEEQIKLGYRREVIRLYYPLKSLNRFLGTRLHKEEMLALLADFQEQEEATLGRIGIDVDGKRFCFLIPEEGVAYVHEHTEPSDFLYDLIRTVSRHGVTIQEVLEQFHRHSDHVYVQKMEHDEYDYLVYFEDGVPDDFRYCLTDEGPHIIYHRFTREDYQDFL